VFSLPFIINYHIFKYKKRGALLRAQRPLGLRSITFLPVLVPQHWLGIFFPKKEQRSAQPSLYI